MAVQFHGPEAFEDFHLVPEPEKNRASICEGRLRSCPAACFAFGRRGFGSFFAGSLSRDLLGPYGFDS
ncbi:MAG: hypothetical protein CSA62_03540 [Planctomycetota bacterium]|nr:MAG: hypothetical protein CSA62_03540 [Planctomycetota bacterium]